MNKSLHPFSELRWLVKNLYHGGLVNEQESSPFFGTVLVG